MIRKLICVLFICSLLCTVASANAAQEIKVEAESITSASAGEAVTVSISVEDNPGIAVLAFDVEYDASCISLKSVTHSDDVFKKNNFTAGDLSKNPYKVLALNASGNRNGNGSLLMLSFFVSEDCPGGVYDVRLTNVECYNIDEEEIVCNIIDGSIAVEGMENEEQNPGDDSADDTPDTPSDIPSDSPSTDSSDDDLSDTSSGDTPDNSSGNSDGEVKPETKPSSASGSGHGRTNTQTKKETVDTAAEETPKPDNKVQNTIVLTIGKKEAVVFGSNVTNDVAPVARNGRTMFPARFVAENLGAAVEWKQETNEVVVTKDSTTIVITINSEIALVNGQAIVLDSPAFAENNRTFAPLRFLAENLGASVEWNQEEQKVTILYK